MSDTTPDKYVCTYFRCMWHGLREGLLIAPDPFNLGEELTACPRCRDDDRLRQACDEPDCWEEATCGMPVDDERRYLRVCSYHMRILKEDANEPST